MNKKLFKKIVTFLFLIIVVNSFAQEEEKDLAEVNNIIKKMFEYTNNRDFDSIMGISHPKLFEIVPKEQMKTVLKMTLEGNNDFSIDIPKIVPDYKLSKIFKEEKDSLKYAFISYDMNMSMTFNNQEFDEEAKKMMTLVMEGKGMNVKFTSDKSLDILKENSITIVLKEKITNYEWVVINYDANSPIMYRLLPSSILDSAKKYRQNLMLKRKKDTEKLQNSSKK